MIVSTFEIKKNKTKLSPDTQRYYVNVWMQT